MRIRKLDIAQEVPKVERRLFVNADDIYVPCTSQGRAATFVIDPWTQHWAIIPRGYERILQRAATEPIDLGGVREILVGDDHYPEIFAPEIADGFVKELHACGIAYSNPDEHLVAGYPVYNKTDELLGLHLEITNACNLQCQHCYVSSGRKLPNELTIKELERVIDMLPPFSGKRVAISGGEPIVRRGCMEIVRYCAIERGHDVDLYSNGYKFPEKYLDELLELNGHASGQVGLQVSLEGASSHTNDRIRGLGAFEQTTRFLHQLRDNGLNRATTIFVCLTHYNMHELESIINLAESFDVARLVFSQWQRQGNATDVPWESIAPKVDEWIAAGERLLSYRSSRLKVTGNFYGDLSNGDLGAFTLGFGLFPKHLYFYNAFPRITPDGEIFASQMWVDPAWSLGNVREMTLDEAFSSPKFHEQLSAMRQRSDNVPECRTCNWKQLCMSGSPGHTYAEYGTLERKDLFCDSRKYWFQRYVDSQVVNPCDA